MMEALAQALLNTINGLRAALDANALLASLDATGYRHELW
jgi:hypothetical protein